MSDFRFEKYITKAARKIKLLLYTAIYRIGFETRCFNLKIPSPEDISLFEIHSHSKQVALYDCKGHISKYFAATEVYPYRKKYGVLTFTLYTSQFGFCARLIPVGCHRLNTSQQLQHDGCAPAVYLLAQPDVQKEPSAYVPGPPCDQKSGTWGSQGGLPQKHIPTANQNMMASYPISIKTEKNGHFFKRQ